MLKKSRERTIQPFQCFAYSRVDTLLFLALSKLCIFGGYAIGTFLAGVVSDNFGRKQAITIFSQLLFCSGIIVTLMPNIMTFSIMWFIVGNLKSSI